MKLEVRDLRVFYGDTEAVRGVSFALPENTVTALIGPSGCGKSTVLRALDRMHDEVPNARVTGRVLLDGEDVYAPHVDAIEVRRRIGMVFQKPNPFPKSIFDNVAFGLRVAGVRRGRVLTERVEEALRHAALWDEVKDRLGKSAMGLSGGQQQRLCIARALAVRPEVLLLDEPTSALDPIATEAIEALIARLRGDVTMAIVTHSLAQARRVADHVAFFYLGDLVEHGPAREVLESPRHERTAAYVGGRVG
ncbi:MAG: phosphate ABC transporter ATP-binding protein [Sandaracinus sp.]|nr:phosphate ABC transporter ATP-binding protein [Sandaracinus sp.]MCB9612043.1 phosphate ABC transporter ATP-binding protein [Sandaracinus sp.]MCB9633149.1 phosphate ABC transporter ATP-binding protein [Sandaracinus sp.]